MKKLLVSLVCALLVVGMADLGHAGLLGFLGGGGGGGKNRAASHAVNPGALANFDFSKFVVKPKSEKPVKEDLAQTLIENFLSISLGDLPGGGGFFGPNNENRVPDVIAQYVPSGGFEEAVNSPRESAAPVPEPATMLLLGAGLIALAGYSRRKFKTG